MQWQSRDRSHGLNPVELLSHHVMKPKSHRAPRPVPCAKPRELGLRSDTSVL